MEPLLFQAYPGDLLEGQALLTNQQDIWREWAGWAHKTYVKVARPWSDTPVLDAYLNSPYTPKHVYDGACNLLEPA